MCLTPIVDLTGAVSAILVKEFGSDLPPNNPAGQDQSSAGRLDVLVGGIATFHNPS
jgi:hypothetical protein